MAEPVVMILEITHPWSRAHPGQSWDQASLHWEAGNGVRRIGSIFFGQGRISCKRLPPGRYRVTWEPLDEEEEP